MTRLLRGVHRAIVSPTQQRLWLALSLATAALYGVLALGQAFSGPYVVQTDARVHVSWMLQFMDPELFPNDVIMEYLSSVEPAGYKALYWLLANVGLDPLVVNKLLPTVLGLIATGYCFGISMRIFPAPAAAFIATVLLNQTAIGITTAVVSGTPRAFVYPLFLAFLYYLFKRAPVPCVVALALQGLFYPQILLVSVGVLGLRVFDWTRFPPRLTHTRSDYVLSLAGLGVALLVLAPYALKTSAFGPVITAAQARTMAEFQPGGGASFFTDNPWTFWVTGQRSGILQVMVPLLLWTGLALPLLLRSPARFPLARWVTKEVWCLPQIALASLVMFGLAHALLFRLHLPSRYTKHSLVIVLALAGGIALTALVEAVYRWAEQPASPPRRRRQRLALGVTTLMIGILVCYPVVLSFGAAPFPRTSYKVGGAPALYAFFAQQPKDSVIASLAEEADNLPTFAKRSVLVARKYAAPYHIGYYTHIHQRATELIRAQYSPELTEARRLIQREGVDFWLLDRGAFTSWYLATNAWFPHTQPAASEALASLRQGSVPALATLVQRCAVFEDNHFIVLEAQCLLEAP